MLENPQLIISILSLIVAICAVFAAYFYYRRTRKYKELSYEISPTLSLIRVGSTIRDRVEIKYKHGDEQTEGLEIKDLVAVPVTIYNTGTEAVKFPQSDSPMVMNTQTPVTIDFGSGAQILGEPTTETSPEERTVGISRPSTAPSKVLMDKFLLNPGESVTVSTFLTDYSGGDPRVDWHIENVLPPRELKRELDVVAGTLVELLMVLALPGLGIRGRPKLSRWRQSR